MEKRGLVFIFFMVLIVLMIKSVYAEEPFVGQMGETYGCCKKSDGTNITIKVAEKDSSCADQGDQFIAGKIGVESGCIDPQPCPEMIRNANYRYDSTTWQNFAKFCGCEGSLYYGADGGFCMNNEYYHITEKRLICCGTESTYKRIDSSHGYLFGKMRPEGTCGVDSRGDTWHEFGDYIVDTRDCPTWVYDHFEHVPGTVVGSYTYPYGICCINIYAPACPLETTLSGYSYCRCGNDNIPMFEQGICDSSGKWYKSACLNNKEITGPCKCGNSVTNTGFCCNGLVSDVSCSELYAELEAIPEFSITTAIITMIASLIIIAIILRK